MAMQFGPPEPSDRCFKLQKFKMAAAAIFKNRKIAISRAGIDQFRPNFETLGTKAQKLKKSNK